MELPTMSERLQKLVARHLHMAEEVLAGRRFNDASAQRQLFNDAEVMDWLDQMDKQGHIPNVSYCNGSSR